MIQILDILGTAAPVSVTMSMIEAPRTSERLLQPDRPWTHPLREGMESQGGSQWIPELLKDRLTPQDHQTNNTARTINITKNKEYNHSSIRDGGC